MQVLTVLTDAEQRDFVRELRARVQTARQKDRSVTRRLKERLGWDSLRRLRWYESSGSFPAPRTLETIARCIGDDWLVTLAHAGYLRETLKVLDALARYDDTPERELLKRRGVPAEVVDDPRSKPMRFAIEFAVERFPRRGERQRVTAYASEVLLSLIATTADRALEARAKQHRMHPDLQRAYAALGSSGHPHDVRRAIAGEYVRAWARDLDAGATSDAERRVYATQTNALALIYANRIPEATDTSSTSIRRRRVS